MINFNTFKLNSNFTNFKANSNKNVSNVNYGNNLLGLKPLSKDTFSFTGGTGLNKSLMKAFDNKEVCKEIYDNAQPVSKDLEKILRESLKDLIADQKHPARPIESIKVRVKSPESIREKAADLLEQKIMKKPEEAFNPKDASDIKKNVQDIIGVRIVLRNPDSQDTRKIILKLIDKVKSNNDDRLNIIKIENYVPQTHKNLQYFSDTDLEKLCDVVNEQRKKNGEKEIKIDKNKKETGYIALHLDLDLKSPDRYVSNKDNYFGEIQIVGTDVSNLKEVEDLCYKIKSNKDIKSGNVAYKPFVKYFENYLGQNEEIKKDFNTYTREAYIMQRKKEPKSLKKTKKEKNTLPTIEDCGLAGKLPKELDFNILSNLKKYCDVIYKMTSSID